MDAKPIVDKRKIATHITEEPGDSTRYSHVFEFSWDKSQFTVHKHPYDSGCSVKLEEYVFLDTKAISELGKEIINKSRVEMLNIVRNNQYVKCMLKEENPHTVGSLARCLLTALK